MDMQNVQKIGCNCLSISSNRASVVTADDCFITAKTDYIACYQLGKKIYIVLPIYYPKYAKCVIARVICPILNARYILYINECVL